jgi:hypothetical protein
MGYAVRSEYTLEFLREPKNYDFIQKRYFLTGTLLATRFDENAIKTLSQKCWHIDDVTGDRIRFLFFVSNEIDLPGYPEKPHFTVSGYEHHNKVFLGSLKEIGFKTNIYPGKETEKNHVVNLLDYSQVRRLASQIGISEHLPCLLWVRHDEPDKLYIDPLGDSSPEDIYRHIRKVSDTFNDKNGLLFEEIFKIETEINKSLKDVKITINSMEKDLGYFLQSNRIQSLKQKLIEIFQNETPLPKEAKGLLRELKELYGDNLDSPVISEVMSRLDFIRKREGIINNIFGGNRDLSTGKNIEDIKNTWNQGWLGINRISQLCTVSRSLIERIVNVLEPFSCMETEKRSYRYKVSRHLNYLKKLLNRTKDNILLFDGSMAQTLLHGFDLTDPVRRIAYPEAPDVDSLPKMAELASSIRECILKNLRDLNLRLWHLSAKEINNVLNLQDQFEFNKSIALAISSNTFKDNSEN